MRRILIGSGLAAGALIVLASAAMSPPIIWPDAPAPPAIAAHVDAARTRLWTEATDGLRVPLHLAFDEAWCVPGGAVALIFEEHRPPYLETSFGYALRGSVPTSPDDAWGGAHGIESRAQVDAELRRELGPRAGPCA